MSKRTIIYIILALLIFVFLRSLVSAQEPPRTITNCPYGDSMTADVCAKFEEPIPTDTKPVPRQHTEKPKPIPQSVVVDGK